MNHGNLLPADEDRAGLEVLETGKPALLIELLVVGQVALGHDAKYLTMLDDCGAIEQTTVIGHWQTHDADDVQTPAEVHQVD